MMDDKPCILVVDDDESTCKSLALVLGKKGYAVETAETGQAALEKARARFFNAAFLDIRLPDIDGVELLASLKEMHPDMALMIVTGYASIKTAVQALDAGASAYITKPVDMDEVLAKLRDSLERQRLVAEKRQAEEALRTERQRLFDVLETLPVMICLLSPDYHITFANKSFRDKFGESHGQHCYEYCFGLTEPCEFCEAYQVLKTGKPHHWEVTTRDGSVVDVNDFPSTDIDGSPMILEMDIDITERKRAEAQLAEQFDELRRWHKATLGREARILELKREVNELLALDGKPPRYPSVDL
jgi:PAS domain S-box-containing protein